MGSELSSNLREEFDTWLQVDYAVTVTDFYSKFSFVTKSVNTRPCVFNAYSSSKQVAFSERWIECIHHKHTVCMKHVMQEDEKVLSRARTDLVRVKSLVRIFKQSEWNNYSPKGSNILQEVVTIFEMTYTMEERFDSSFQEAKEAARTTSHATA